MNVLQLITRALRMNKILGVGEDPAADAADDCLSILQSQLLLMFPRKPTDVLVTADYTAGENERIFDQADTSVAITLPETVTGSDGVERPPHDGATATIAGSPSQRFIYISDLGGWQELTSLALTTENPLGVEFDEPIAAILAANLSEFGAVPQETLLKAQAGRSAILSRFRQPYTSAIDPVLTRAWRAY